MENITLEEAFEAIDSYLEEAQKARAEEVDTTHEADKLLPKGTNPDPKHLKFKQRSIPVKTDRGVKESVDEMKLRVFEAYEAGMISEENKHICLEFLNPDNYE